jgi:molecular chaperone GrpE
VVTGEGSRSRKTGEFGGGLSGQPPPPRAHSSAETAPTAADSEAPPSPANGEKQQEEHRDEREHVERERDEYLELARRTKADFENYRKRVAGEAAQAEKRGRAELVKHLLPVIDNLERALSAESAGSEALGEGVRLVSEELAAVLRRSGVESYEPAGERFDPTWHEAMMVRPSEIQDDGKVLEVLEKGYRLDGQVLRPARVVVGEKQTLGERPSGGEPPDGSEERPSGGKPPDGFVEG